MYVEDKVTHRGPFSIDVVENKTVAQLKKQIEQEFEIPINVQRWILGKELVTDDNTTLKDHKITEGCPVFLYLVAPDTQNNIHEVSPKDTKTDLPSSSKANKENKGRIEIERTIQLSDMHLRKVSNEEENVKKGILEKQHQTFDHSPKIIDLIPKGPEPNGKNETQTEKITKTEQQRNNHISKLKKIEAGNIVRSTELNTRKDIKTARPKLQEPKLEKVKTNSISTNSAAKSNLLKLKETGVESKCSQGKGEITIERKSILAISEPHTTNSMDQQSSRTLVANPPKAKIEEDLEDDKNTTLKPAKEWECHLCTLFNPISSNVCAVCATVRFSRAPPKKSLKRKAPQPQTSNNQTAQTYLQLMNLDNADLVDNVEAFECVICFLETAPKEGATLRECLHQFCKNCLAQHIEYSDDAEIKCPYRNDDYSCNIAMQDREIKALVTKNVYEQYLAKSVAQAENRIDKTFHCKSPDCKGWCIFEDNVNEFRCPVCRKTNCLTCQTIHMGLNCKQYQEKTMMDSEVDDNAKRTREMLEEMVEKGEALGCPTCQVVLMKKWGCDWVRCSVCRTEICWVTKGPRWGPDGKGDTSAGCRCGMNGIKCHPKCNYCH